MITSALPHIELPSFDGPLALLIELIERDKLEVTSISVEAITAEYLMRVSELKDLDITHLSEFVQLGSRLVYIKSLALLPEKTVQAEELALLEQDLSEYRRYREAADQLQSQARTSRAWPSGASYEAPAMRIASEVSLEQLSAAFSLALKRTQPIAQTAILKRHLDIRHVITNLLRKAKKAPITLQTLIDDCGDRLEIIVTFLAMLETIKSGQITINQDSQFGDIIITPGIVA
ncbi:MAG: ScpA family protein [Candidatus Saccharibacteria bacterium]